MNNHFSAINVYFNLLFLVLSCLSGNAWSQPAAESSINTDSITLRMKALTQDASSIASKAAVLADQREKLTVRIAELLSRPIDKTEVERARLDVGSASATMQSIELDIITANQQKESFIALIKTLKSHIQTLSSRQQNEAIKNDRIQTEMSLSEKEQLLELELKQLSVLHERKQLVSERLKLKGQWLTEIQRAFQNQQEQLREQNLGELEKQLSEERATWQQKAKEYSSKLELYSNNPSSSPSKLEYIGALLLEAEDSIFLIDIRLKTSRIQAKLEESPISNIIITTDINQLQGTFVETERLKVQTNSLIELLNIKNNLLSLLQNSKGKRLKVPTITE